MTIRGDKKDQKFYVIGISYEKADAEARGKFTFFPETVEKFVSDASLNGLDYYFVVSTCNRTECYGFATSAEELIQQFCRFTEGSVEEFRNFVTIKEGREAVEHLFRVSSGLESQILGDFDIIGQIKIWFSRFKKQGSTNAFLERLVNTAIQISKRVKNETLLSNGSASVAFSAVAFILNNYKDLANKNILLYGLGKIGRNTCANLVKHANGAQITIVNRTREKADVLGDKYEVIVKDHTELISELANTDILIVATGATNHTITEEMIPFDKEMLIIDMSVPENVAHSLATRDNIRLLNVDGLSKMVDDTIATRKAAIPDAEAIILELMQEFGEWLKTRELVPYIQSFKSRLQFIQHSEVHNMKKDNMELDENEIILASKLVQRMTNQFASYLLENREQAEDTYELMQKMFRLKEA
ncbi:glutamyl-tRNA reductase [Vaginella massiliensis]|uniref:glutamyl-tRNA reductase n=1 Tax=Vaginella massiliensis TaxID=1816680 RepID=UPI0037533E17